MKGEHWRDGEQRQEEEEKNDLEREMIFGLDRECVSQ